MPAGSPQFDIVRRGYDRAQVDAQLRELRGRLATAESARQAAEQQARTARDDPRGRATSPAETPAVSQESFGFRAEKILRLAENEAADARNRAAAEATTVVEQARADAERHRHEVEQSLIARSAELDQEAAQRNIALQEREQQAAAALSAARGEATRIAGDAEKTAQSLITDSKRRAEELRERSEQEARRRRETAEHELQRIELVHEGIRTEMARLHTILNGELEAGSAPPDPPDAGQNRGRGPRHSGPRVSAS